MVGIKYMLVELDWTIGLAPPTRKDVHKTGDFAAHASLLSYFAHYVTGLIKCKKLLRNYP